MRIWLFLSLCFYILHSTAEEYLLDAQVITPQKKLLPLNVMTFNHEEFAGKYQNAGDFLRQQAGVQVRSSGIGNPVSISIRGSTHKQVKFIVDGHEVNDAQYGGFDLNKLPLQHIQQIKVIQGASASHSNSNAVGGTILIKTLSAQEKSNSKVFSSIGSYDTYSYGLTHYFNSVGNGVISIDNTSSDANYEYPVPSPYDAPKNKNQLEALHNNQFKKTSVLAKWQGQVADKGLLGLKATYLTSSKNLPNYEQNRITNSASITTSDWELQAYLDSKLDQQWRIKNEFLVNIKHELFDDKNNQVGIGYDLTDYNTRIYRFKQAISYDSIYFNAEGFYLFNTEYFKDNHMLIDNELKCLEPNSLCDIKSQQNTQKIGTNFNWYSKKTVHQVNLNSSITQLNRKQKKIFIDTSTSSKTEYYTSWRSEYINTSIDNSRISVNFGQANRIPSLYEIFGDRGLAKSNLALKPEQSTNLGLDIAWSYRLLSVTNNLYYRQLKNAIVAQLSGGISTYKNMSSAKIAGWQTSVNYQEKKYTINFDIQIQDSLTDSEVFSSDNKKLSGIFHKSLGISFDYILDKELSVQYHYQNDQELYIDAAHLGKHGGRIISDIRLNYNKNNTTGNIAIENIFNKKFNDINNRPSPGRLLSLNLQYQFK
jgi:vitamin B12 transporter